MEFWGVEVPPKKEINWEFDEDNCYIHVSNLALGETDKCDPNERIVVRVKTSNTDVVLGTLTPKTCDQIGLDLIFGEEFTVSHNGNCSVFFSGYRTEGPQGRDDDDGMDSYDEGEELEYPLPTANGGSFKVLKGPKTGNKIVESSDEESSDEDDSSDDSLGDDLSDHLDDSSDDSDDSSDDDDDDDSSDDDDFKDIPKDVPIPEPTPSKANKKKRPAESPAAAPSPPKKIKTPSKPVQLEKVKPEKKSAQKPQTPAQKPQTAAQKPQTPASTEKATGKKKDKAPKTPDTKSKDGKAAKVATPGSATPGSQGKTKYHCKDCARFFANETGLTQHNAAKHKK